VAVLSLSKSYEDGQLLLENDFSVWLDEIEAFVNGQLSGDNLQEESLTGASIQDASITTAKIIDNAVTSNKLSASTVTTTNINNSAIITNKIMDAAITTNKLATSAVTNPLVSNSSLQNSKVAQNYVIVNIPTFTSSTGSGLQLVAQATIITTGRPVVARLIPTPGTTTSVTNTGLFMGLPRLKRGDFYAFTAVGANFISRICTSFIDVPSAGTHTYELVIERSSGATTTLTGFSLYIKEL